MIFGRKVINLLFTDNSIQFALVEERNKKVLRVGKVNLKSGIIVNGKITDEKLLSSILGAMFKRNRLRQRFVRLIIPDNNLVIKKLNVPSFLKTNDLKNYLKLELEESLQTLPYKDPILDVKDYKVYPEKDDKSIILFTTSEEIITAYLRVIQRHGKSVVSSDVSPVLIRRMYLDSKGLRSTAERHVLYAQLRQNHNILTIFDDELPVLSLRDTFEIDDLDEADYLEQIVNIIERICHFYKYKFTENDEVEKVVIYSEDNLNETFKENIKKKIDYEVEFVLHPELNYNTNITEEELIENYLPIALSL